MVQRQSDAGGNGSVETGHAVCGRAARHIPTTRHPVFLWTLSLQAHDSRSDGSSTTAPRAIIPAADFRSTLRVP